MVTQLMHETAHLTTAQTGCSGVIDQADLFGPFDQPIEMVGPYTVLMLISRQPKTTAQVIGDEGIRRFMLRKHTLIHRENDQTIKIQRTGLQDTHNLQARERFSLKRDRDPIGHTF